jgi:hypothetical protein
MADEALASALARGHRIGAPMIRICSFRKTLSKLAVNFGLGPTWNLTGRAHSTSTIAHLRHVMADLGRSTGCCADRKPIPDT